MISKFIKNQLKNALLLGALFLGGNVSAQLGLTWSEMGPNDISGRTRSILIDRQDLTNKTIYAAGVSGGIFKSTNSGLSWAPLNDQTASLIVSCMSQAADGTIFFGTGETFGRGGDGAGASGFIGTGLYKMTPTSGAVTLVQDSALFGNVNEIAINQTGTIYVAANKGFFFSTDGGATFTQVTESGSLPGMDVKINTLGDVFFSAGSKDSKTSKVFFKASSSSTYTDITPTNITDRGRIEIAVAPTDPNFVYLSIAKQKTVTTTSGNMGGILVSDNKGASWVTITPPTSQVDPMVFGTTGYGDYANTIVVDPYNKNVIYLGSQAFYEWDQIIGNPLGQGNWIEIAFTTAPIPSPSYVHSKIHDFKFDLVNNTGYIATDAGIYKSVSNNSGFLPVNNGLNISQFNSVTFPIYPRNNPGTPTNVVVPYAGVAGGSIGNSLTYLPGNLNTTQNSNSFGSSDAFQSDFSKLSPKSVFYAGAYGTIFRTSDITLSPFSTFYDIQYRLKGGAGTPGGTGFANENTPMRLWENYKTLDSAIFMNEINSLVFQNTINSKSTFTIGNTRPQASAKYDTVAVTTTSLKKLGQSLIATQVFTNTNVSATTFTVPNTRAKATAKYDSIIVKMTSFKLLSPPAAQSFSMTMVYTGSVVTGYRIVGAGANTVTATNNMVFPNSNLNDSIRFTFNTAPNDSSVISVRIRYKYSQNLKLVPTYSGSSITAVNVIGEGNTSSVSNNTVFINSNKVDSVRFSFANNPGDSCNIFVTTKLRYDIGDVIELENTDISGQPFTTSVTLTSPLNSTANATVMPIVKLPLKRSARLAVGTSASGSTESPNVFIVKRPLNFGTNPDWFKISGKNSRMDGPGGVPSTTISPVIGTTITRLEWANNGNYIYFSTKQNDTTYYVYRISHLEVLGDSSSTDYSGTFTSDIDSGATYSRKALTRTTALGKFKYPVTGIAISNDDKSLLITCGSYKNKSATVYTSNSDITTMNMNNTDASNFTVKNGTGLPAIPVYTGLFEVSDNKVALIGTENGIYSTSDVTVASPTWVKENGGNFPNVPVYQLRQQTFPSYQCYNHGVIYAATHGRGIWSTDKYAVPYAIGIEENEVKLSANENMKLYPNPAADATNVLFTAQGDASYNVTVYDISGRILIQEKTSKLMGGENTLTLNTSDLTSGVYFVTINGTNNFNGTSKLVITK